MPSLINRVAALARSPQGRKLVEQAKEYADQAKEYAAKPENKQKIEQLRAKVSRRGTGGGTRGTY
jgi:hypothetical protein